MAFGVTVEDEALRQLVERVNGFVYAGDRLNAIVDAVKVLRADPELAARVLGTGEQSIKPTQHCTSEECEYTLSHTAQWCRYDQPRRCGCPYCYPKGGKSHG